MLCSNYIFLLDSVLVGYLFSEICPLLGCPVFWHLVVHSILLQFFLFSFFLYFCGIECYFSPISYFAYSGPLSFPLGELARGLLGLFTISKKWDFGFIDFSISLLFISSLILIIFFFLLTWDCCCCCSFSSSVRW